MANGYIPAAVERGCDPCSQVNVENKAFLGGVLGIDVNGELQPISDGGIVDLTFIETDIEQSAERAAQSAVEAEAAKEAAENASAAAQGSQMAAHTAATAAELAQEAAETAKTAAQVARAGAETARTGAEAARTAAQTAQTGAQSAQTAAQSAATAAAGSASDASTSATAAAGSATQAATSATNAASSATAASSSASDAATSATAAGASATAASASATAAQTAQTAAETAQAGAEAVESRAVEVVPGVVTGWLDEHVTQETGYVLDDTLTIASAAADSKAVGDMLEIGGRTVGFVQGARNASGSITSNAKRCTTSETFQLVAGDVIQITNLDSGIKAAIAGVSGGSFIHDSGWLTQSDIYFVVGTAGTYFVNFAKVVDGNLSPSGIVTASVKFKDHSYFNRLEVVPAVESEIDSVSETAGIAKDVSILAIFDDGYYVNGNTGVRNGRSEQSASRYIEIPTGFDTIEISMLVQKSEYPQGIAFYTGNQDSSFISGAVFPYDTSLAQLSQEVGIITIPRTAKYFRTSWVATTYEHYSDFAFSCKLVRNGKFAEVDGSSIISEAFTIDGFVNITKADMEGGTLDGGGFLPNLARCRTANRYIKARKGDIVVGHRKTADILMAVVDDAVGSNILYSSGWRTADFALKTPNDGYYALLGKTSLNNFDGEFTIYSAKQQYKGLPDSYYQAEVDATLTAITNAQSEPCLCFPLVTDIHYGATSSTDQPFLFHKTFRNMLKIAQEKKCDAVVNLGDIMDGSFSAKQTAMDYAMRVNDMLMSLSVPYLISLGNHDDNHYYTGSNQRLSVSDLYKVNLAYTGGKPHYNASIGGRDYYVDFDNLKIRLVCLNSYNYQSSAYAYADETVLWFTNIALDTPDGYLVVVLTHISPISSQNYNNTSVTNGTAIAQAVENYISGGKPAIQFYGHSHCDVAFTSPYLSISTCCNKFEDENGDPTLWPSGATMPERTEKTASEDLWDFVVIKPASRTVDLIRFGAGNDRTFTY